MCHQSTSGGSCPTLGEFICQLVPACLASAGCGICLKAISGVTAKWQDGNWCHRFLVTYRTAENTVTTPIARALARMPSKCRHQPRAYIWGRAFLPCAPPLLDFCLHPGFWLSHTDQSRRRPAFGKAEKCLHPGKPFVLRSPQRWLDTKPPEEAEIAGSDSSRRNAD